MHCYSRMQSVHAVMFALKCTFRATGLFGNPLRPCVRVLRGSENELEFWIFASSVPPTHFVFAVTDIKAWWKNLKDTYCHILKAKLPLLKSGAGAEELDRPRTDVSDNEDKWVHYDTLHFLAATITTKGQVWFLWADLLTTTSRHWFFKCDKYIHHNL